MKKTAVFPAVVAVVVLFLASCQSSVEELGALTTASAGCLFADTGSEMVLQADCITDQTVTIPDGYTLDGNGHSITAVDPNVGSFLGAVVQNEGSTAYVTDLTVTASDLAAACHSGSDRLAGIRFAGASGSITHSEVVSINQGSGCQEGNAIEVTNRNGSERVSVEVAHNTVDDYQKTGIVALGNVDVDIHHNDVGASATQELLGANSIQVGGLSQATGSVSHNRIAGNQWLGSSNYAATAVIVFFSGGDVYVGQNQIRGNSDIAIAVAANNVSVDNNKVFESGKDGLNGDYGIVNYYPDAFLNNVFSNNKVRGFETPYYGVEGGGNKVISGAQPSNPWF